MRVVPSLLLSCLPLAAQASWTQLNPSQSPPLRGSATYVSHEASGSLLQLFGFDLASGTFATTAWRLQGGSWALQPGPLPPLRDVVSTAYDAVRQQAVLFGGYSPITSQMFTDTWLWDGAHWTQANPALSPSARQAAAMGFDHRRGVVVLFGGRDAFNQNLNDTWEWNGTTWQLHNVPNPPSGRVGAMLAFDPVNGALVLHGGSVFVGQYYNVFNDTWSYDGTQWQQRFPATPPSPRLLAGMVTDLHRQRVVMLGGVTNDPFAWEWDGAQWTPRYQANPAPRAIFGIGYDALARRAIVTGGYVQLRGNTVWLNDTWSFQTPLPADVVPFGSGCAGTAGTPALTAKAFSLPWLGDTMVNVVEATPAASPGAFFVSSFGSTPPLPLAAVGMPGCDLLVPLDVIEFGAAAAGRAEWALAIPNTPALAAVQFRQQAFVIDTAANALGLVASDGVVVTLGVR